MKQWPPEGGHSAMGVMAQPRFGCGLQHGEGHADILVRDFRAVMARYPLFPPFGKALFALSADERVAVAPVGAPPFAKGGWGGFIRGSSKCRGPKIPPNPPFSKGGTKSLWQGGLGGFNDGCPVPPLQKSPSVPL
jgi:hypothetical protein